MRILALYNSLTGVEYHRIIKPLQRMQVDYLGQVDIFTGTNLEKNGVPPLQNYDLIIFNRHLGVYHDKLIEFMGQNNIPYIIDIDDWWKLPRHHPGWNYYKANQLEKKIPEAIRYANLVTCSTEELATHIRAINPKVRILPNALDTTDEQWNQPPVSSNKMRFLYAPAMTHYNDMLFLGNIITRLCHIYPDNVEFIYSGYAKGPNGEKIPAVESMLNRFNGHAKETKPQIKVIQAAPPNEYGKGFAHADCVLAPLEDTKYNNCKSDLKIQEAAAYQLPIICSNCLPYTEQKDNPGVIFADSEEEWFNAMASMIEAKIAGVKSAKGTSNMLYNDQARNLEKINHKRFQAFQWVLQSAINARQ